MVLNMQLGIYCLTLSSLEERCPRASWHAVHVRGRRGITKQGPLLEHSCIRLPLLILSKHEQLAVSANNDAPKAYWYSFGTYEVQDIIEL